MLIVQIVRASEEHCACRLSNGEYDEFDAAGNLVPSRLSLDYEDGEPCKLGSGGFGQVHPPAVELMLWDHAVLT